MIFRATNRRIFCLHFFSNSSSHYPLHYHPTPPLYIQQISISLNHSNTNPNTTLYLIYHSLFWQSNYHHPTHLWAWKISPRTIHSIHTFLPNKEYLTRLITHHKTSHSRQTNRQTNKRGVFLPHIINNNNNHNALGRQQLKWSHAMAWWLPCTS